MSDQQLLQQFVKDQSQAAFAALVQRHVNMVYSAALRQVRDPHLAEDVTQAVFVVLHRKSAKLPAMPTLGGWLLKVTRYAAVDAMRKRARQDRHERAAAKPEAAPLDTSADWRSIAPILDEALAKLSDTDRNAIVMRYLEDATFPEVGEKLGIGEEAARKRVGRAVLKLRGLLAGKGVAISVGGLTTAMAANAIMTAPAHVGVAAAAVAAGSVSAGGASIAGGAMSIMTMAKAKLAAGVAAAALLLGAAGTGVVMHAVDRPNTHAATKLLPAMDTSLGVQLLGPWHTYIDSDANNPMPPRARILFTPDRLIASVGFGTDEEETEIFSYGIDPDRQPPYIGLVSVNTDEAYEGYIELDGEFLRLTVWDDPRGSQRERTPEEETFVLHRGEPGGPDYVCDGEDEQAEESEDGNLKQTASGRD
jgi:RNA polymerase sigma factor (sigma-70 family)